MYLLAIIFVLSILTASFPILGAQVNVFRGGKDFVKKITIPALWTASIFFLVVLIYFLLKEQGDLSSKVINIKKGFFLPLFVSTLSSLVLGFIFLIKEKSRIREYLWVNFLPGLVFLTSFLVLLEDIIELLNF
jgi:hypothetical protein